MDARPRNSYVACAMNLLLLLSALLSALTGVGVRVAAPEQVQAVAKDNARVAVVAASVRPHSLRPVVALPSLRKVALATAFKALEIARIPAWATRRRE